MTHPTLRDWALQTVPSDDMLWEGAYGDQILFLRDPVAYLIGVGLDYEDCEGLARVISSHRSKSITLPVVEYSRPDLGLRFIVRNNFYNWKLSVISEYPIIADFDGLFFTDPPVEPEYTGDPLAACYFEGFPKDRIFGYYETSDKRKFSAEIDGDYCLWMTLFTILKSVGAIRKAKWHTRESHKAEMEEQTAREVARKTARSER